jgi:hypothetical protein
MKLSKIVLLSLMVTSLYGQATRTWVSGFGDDANPCSRTAPCKTFAGAISKTTAGGEIDVLDPGGFGALTITKAITIDGTPVVSGVLVTGTNGINVSAGSSDLVILRGLDFNGVAGQGLKGVAVFSAGKVIIDHCKFFGFSPRAISVEPTSNPVEVFISNTQVTGSASNGIVVAPASPSISARVTINKTDISANTNYGLSVTSGGVVVIRDSTISDNGLTSALANIRVDGSSGAAIVDLDDVLIAGSATGIQSVNGATVRVNNSSILQNGTGLFSSGGNILSFGNNRLANGSNGSFTGTITFQ